ncbi:MAG: hypothetical protein HRU28_00750 [Rhizobiales bacterium]|nr:hypothetical protein [Hyphomicrobiales bacterium]
MSQWVTDFKNHNFHINWNNVINLAKTLESKSDIPRSDLSKVARFIKAVSFINELVISSDPELVPVNVWNVFDQQLATLYNNINTYSTSFNVPHLDGANNIIDVLLNTIQPYVKNGKTSAQAASGAFKAYANLVKKQFDTIHNKENEAVLSIGKDQATSNLILEKIEGFNEKIELLKIKLIDGDEDNTSIENQIDEILGESNHVFSIINNYQKKIFDGVDGEVSIEKKIVASLKNIEENKDAIEILEKSSSESFNNIEEYVTEVYGEKDSEGVRDGGLQGKLNDYKIGLETQQKELTVHQQNIEDFRKIQEDNYEKLKTDIESLLPGAVSAGLASSYKDLKDEFKWPVYLNSAAFMICLVGVGGITFWSYTTGNNTATSFLDRLSEYAFRLPMALAPLWLALYFSKRRSEAKRLQQEYAHKEAILKSYIGFKNEIEKQDKLGAGDSKLMNDLLAAAIKAISINASDTLDKKHGDNTPVGEISEKLLDKILSKIPSK